MSRAPGGRFGRSFIILFVIFALSAAVLTGCGPLKKAGTRCNTKELAHDATHILQCKSKRWRRIMTRQQAVAFWVAIINKKKEEEAAAAAARAAAAAAAPPTTPWVGAPAGLPGPPSPALVATGSNHSCAVVGGGVKCWGSNSAGQGGRGSLGSSGPTAIAALGLSGVTNIAAQGSSTCAVVAGGKVECWGDNYDGQLGNGKYDNEIEHILNPAIPLNYEPGKPYETTPVEVIGPGNVPLTGAVRVDMGDAHGCALIWNGDVYCWGNADSGRLGNGAYHGRYLSAQRVGTPYGPLTGAVSLSVGSFHSCVTTNVGTVWCWGANNGGQLGIGMVTPQNVDMPLAQPVQMLSWAGSGYLAYQWAVSAAQGSTCAIGMAVGGNVIRCWGTTSEGQLGINTGTSIVEYATDLTVYLANPVALSAGIAHYCATNDIGQAVCWGRGTSGQLGSGQGNQWVPQLVPGLGGLTQTALSPDHSCARRNDGAVFCWGSDVLGKSGGAGGGPTYVPT